MQPRVALYSHDTYGLGHLSRSLGIAWSLVERFGKLEGILLTGSPWWGRLPAPREFEVMPLRSLVKVGRGRYASRGPGELQEVMAHRRQQLSAVLDGFRPQLLLVDNVPAGLLGEMAPVLRRLKRDGTTRIVLALRDILDEPTWIADEWRSSGADRLLREVYDEIWVFGDDEDVDALLGIEPLARVADRVRVCGRILRSAGRFVEVKNPPSTSEPSGLGGAPGVLVTVGGGGDGEHLVKTFLRGVRTSGLRFSSRVVLGPDYPQDPVASPSGGDLEVRRFVPDLESRMRQADVVVAMAGYNSVCEILAAGSRAVLVPRVQPRREQLLRARKWARRGRMAVLDPEALTVKTLWQAIEGELHRPRWQPEVLSGGEVAAERAADLLELEGGVRVTA